MRNIVGSIWHSMFCCSPDCGLHQQGAGFWWLGCLRVRKKKVSCRLWTAGVYARVAVVSQWCWDCHCLCGRRSMLSTAGASQPSLWSPFSKSLEDWGCTTSPELSVVGSGGKAWGGGECYLFFCGNLRHLGTRGSRKPKYVRDPKHPLSQSAYAQEPPPCTLAHDEL